ncbi:EAL domain-containing protein [Sphingomonas xinjiangensis]|uniref:EAL domain-containing protein (Putative c-di-GMP-specific phosphodiesterase class I) n=1 Tax=Sphingomonas xinjiangensis TaxID=643568 RepID=A0A840YB44_9SPHN|nr:EAL domain-containing protein [Sphingomonas xinjiangensis]MBB5710074.1 EAL domain-containing protein (putative c-di-GMP-specific phosphodiesterase class I) [Sphingomonas xinjiangensis]
MTARTVSAIDPRLALSISFQPMTATGVSQPFAYAATARAQGGRSFAAALAMLPLDQRPALEASGIALVLEAAVAAGLRENDALLAIPVGAAAGMAEPLLSHLFRTALAYRFPLERIVVEINADERGDLQSAAALARVCSGRGLAIAFDGFAAGPIALKLLGSFTPRYVKLDPALVRNIDASLSRRLIAEGVMRLARSMGVTVVARGAESAGECHVLAAIGVRHVQAERPLVLAKPEMPRREARYMQPAHRRLAHHQRAGSPMHHRQAQPDFAIAV